jgi:hypothetical protein
VTKISSVLLIKYCLIGRLFWSGKTWKSVIFNCFLSSRNWWVFEWFNFFNSYDGQCFQIKLMLSCGYIDGAFSLSALLNCVVILTLQNTKSSSGTLVISNTFPQLLSNPKRMDIISILQVS